MNAYLKLSVAALMPVVVAAIIYLLDKKTSFGKIDSKLKQVIIGVIFGGLAIVGTEWGIPLSNAQANCRDAAVLISGLMFGAPAGIIAGCIGALERWVAVAWGIGTFTRVACTVSTFIAGIYSAALRKYMFEDRKPGALLALAIGVVMEVFHLTMVFITNMDTPNEAIAVIQGCTLPMVTANGISVMLAALCLAVLGKDSSLGKGRSRARISQTIQRWLLLTVVLAFIITSLFVFNLQTKIADTQTDTLLSIAINETAADIEDFSDDNILYFAREIAEEIKSKDLNTIAEEYNVAEVNVFDESGTVVDSSVPENIGLKAVDYKSSSEFLCLLDDETELVQTYRPCATDDALLRRYAGVSLENGFLQVGYDTAQFQEYIDAEVVNITRNRHVGETGYILIIDKAGKLVSCPEGMTNESLYSDGVAVGEVPPDTTIAMSISGEDCFCRYRTDEGYYIISVQPQAEALKTRNLAMYVNSFMEILVFAVLFALIYMLIKRIVVNRIEEVNRSLAKITGGDLNEVVNVRSNEEFASLSDDINTTVDTLKRYIDEASARIDQELEFAKNIQSSALPSIFPAFPKRKDFDIYASMNPAKEVGGDFYDFYMTHTDTLNFLVADVSGKGIPAAMFMMRAKTELKSLTEADMKLCDVFTHGNAALCEGNDAGMFVTAWQGSIDLETGLLQYANAGHNPPLIRRAGGKFEYLKSRTGFILAGMDGMKYKTQELQLEPGDIVYLYTDGVTEATNLSNELYGEERLVSAINSKEFESMQELCAFIKADVAEFVGEAAQFDDITMVAFKYIGKPPVPTIHFDEAKIDDITAVTEFIEAELEKIDCPMRTVIQINVAIDELFSNIVKYGYPKAPGPVTVQLIVKDDPRSVYIRFADEGIPYNPLTKQDPDITLSADEREIGGLGIYMVKQTMDDVKYKYENDQNILTIQKLIK